MAEWIKVSERLPEGGESVLTFRDGYRIVPINVEMYMGGWSHDLLIKNRVTHWQPLPPPPPEAE